MRANKSSFGEKISNWKVLQTNLQPHLTEMPHLGNIQVELQTLIAQAEALDSDFELARQQKTALADLARMVQAPCLDGQGLFAPTSRACPKRSWPFPRFSGLFEAREALFEA